MFGFVMRSDPPMNAAMLFQSDHIETLKSLARFLSATKDPWWVLGSAAIALTGTDPDGIRDIDVLVSLRDSAELMRLHQLENQADGGNALFRSDVFLRPQLGSVPVEVMSNYCINADGEWDPLSPKTRESVELAGAQLYVPDLLEQLTILRSLGRPKDLQRIALLQSAHPELATL